MNKFLQQISVIVTIIAILYYSAIAGSSDKISIKTPSHKAGKSIIIMVPDGCGTGHIAFSRWIKGGKLYQDFMNAGLVRTNSANSLITGSAAASTAFATGYKTWEQDGGVKCLGILPDSCILPISPQCQYTGKLPDSLAWRPVASVLEGARLSGKSTGLIATSRISHATPAGFSSHWHDRDNDNVIIEQQVHENIDVVFGGGLRHLIPSALQSGKRNDNDNLKEVLIARGYAVISNKTELQQLPSATKKVWGLFNNSHMSANINRKFTGREEPSLSDMTEKALSILSQNKNGFFLVVEGSQVDWASHNNDPVGVASEYLAFDSAVGIALEYAKQNKNVELLVFSDHDNGGLTIGNISTNKNYTALSPENVISVIKKPQITSFGFIDSLIRLSKSNVIVDSMAVTEHLNSLMGISLVTDADTANIHAIVLSVKNDKTGDQDVANIGALISRRASIGWTTSGHTANDVPFYSLRKKTFVTIDNTDIAEYASNWLGLDIKKVNSRLVNDVHHLFKDYSDIRISIDSVQNSEGKGSLAIEYGTNTFNFPFYKNIMISPHNDTLEMEGLTLYTPKTNKVYLPLQARKLVLSKR